MQEDIEQRTVTLIISTSKLTARELRNALSKYLNHVKGKKKAAATRDVHPRGKQSMKQLVGQNQGVTSIDVAQSGIRDFEKVARKYKVDYAVKKDNTGPVTRYMVFFKARDGDAMNAAFQEYTAKTLKRADRVKPSVLKKLNRLKAAVKADPTKVKHRERER